MPHILFISSNRIGDAVLSSGAIDHVRTLVPGADVTFACGPLPAPLFRSVPGVSKTHVFQKQRGDRHWFDLIKKLRGERYDLAIDLRGSLVTYLLRVKKRIVFRKVNAIQHKVQEVSALMRSPRALEPKLCVDAQARADAQAAFAHAGPMLVLGAGASSIAKRWRPERFAATARRLVSASGVVRSAHVVLLGGPEDSTIGAEIAASLDADGVMAHDLSGRLDLLACAALLERATLFVGNDSGLMHIAAAAGAPTLGLFGPTDERVYGPWGARARAVRGRPYAELSPRAPLYALAATMMDDLTVDAVEAAAGDLMRAGGLA